MSKPACPTPEKVAYRKQAAKSALRRIQKQHLDTPGRLTVYRCPVGHWHLGHVEAPPRKAAGAAS